MIDFTTQTSINRPVEEVFAYVTDPEKLPTWQTNKVSSVPDGDGTVRLGTRLTEVTRMPGGKQVTSVFEVSEYEPPTTFALVAREGPVPINGHLTFTPAGAGTQVQFRVYGQLTGPMRLAEPLMQLGAKRQFAGYLSALKRALEQA